MPTVRTRILWFFAGAALAALVIALVYQIPFVKDRLEWRLDAASGIVRGWILPGDTLPTPQATRSIQAPTRPPATATPAITAAPIPTSTPLPSSVALTAPA